MSPQPALASSTTVEQVSPFLRLLAEPNRLRILVLLTRGEQCVCEIEQALDLPQNLTSHHLAVLRRAGLLADRREGRWVYYRLAPEALRCQLSLLTTLLHTGQADQPAQPCAPEGGS